MAARPEFASTVSSAQPDPAHFRASDRFEERCLQLIPEIAAASYPRRATKFFVRHGDVAEVSRNRSSKTFAQPPGALL